MKTKGSKPSEYTRGLIKEKLKEDADCEIATTMLRVSLICPLGKMRMTTPCRWVWIDYFVNDLIFCEFLILVPQHACIYNASTLHSTYK
jgi:hypothetical protein